MTTTSLIAIEERALSLPDQARALTIATDEHYQLAAGLLREIKGLQDQLDTALDGNIKAAHDLHKRLVAQKREIGAPLADASTLLRQGMLAYETQQREAAEAAAEALATSDTPELAALPAPAAPKVEGVQTRTRWTGEVTDFAALVQAAAARPELLALLKPDQVAINKYAGALKDTMDVPGLRATPVRSIAAAAR